jgi:hypothetical protein
MTRHDLPWGKPPVMDAALCSSSSAEGQFAEGQPWWGGAVSDEASRSLYEVCSEADGTVTD